MTRSVLTFSDGLRTVVEVGDPDDAEAELAVTRLLSPPGASILGPWGEAGGPATIHAAYELLRRQVNGLTAIVDGAFVGHNAPSYGGNYAFVNRTRSRSLLGQHLVEPLDGDDRPIPPATHLFQSIDGRGHSVTLNRPAHLIERTTIGSVTAPTPVLALRRRMDEGASDTGPWIADDRTETFAIMQDGTFFTRGGLFVLGDNANLTVRGGSLFVDYGGAICALGPGTNSDSASGTSIALLRSSGTSALLGDIYGSSIVLSLTGSTSKFDCYGLDASMLELDGQSTIPAQFTASNWGLWVDSDDDRAYFWDGTTSNKLAYSSELTTAPLTLTVDDANNTSVQTVLTLAHTTSGAPGGGLGARLVFSGEDSTPSTAEYATIYATATDVTAGSVDAAVVVTARGGGSDLEVARFNPYAWAKLTNYTTNGSAATRTTFVSSRTGASASAGSTVGLEFQDEDGAGSTVIYGRLDWTSSDVTAGSVDTDVVFTLKSAGADTERLRVLSGGSFRITEVSAPSTPASGYYALWAGTDGLRGKTSGGTTINLNVADRTSFTPTGSWSTNTTYTGFWWRVGDTMHASVQVATSGAPTAATFTLNIPLGATVDEAKLLTVSGASDHVLVGQAHVINDAATDVFYVGQVFYDLSANNLVVRAANDTAGVAGATALVSDTVPFSFGSGDSLQLKFDIPISTWTA